MNYNLTIGIETLASLNGDDNNRTYAAVIAYCEAL